MTSGLAVVTGASRGIGRAVAHALAADGMRVAMLARGRDALDAAATAVGSGAFPIVCDVRDLSAVERAAATIREHGIPDVLVNNAGLFELRAIEDLGVDRFAETIRTNLVAPFAFIRAFLADMRGRGSGHIITLGSIADRAAFPENGAYAASKFGLRALHQVLRVELRGSGVRASLISPGPVDTPLWDDIDPDNRPGFTSRADMLRPDAVAAAVRYALGQPRDVNVDELRLSRS